MGAAPLTAHATTAPTLTLTQQARKADVIVRATLGTPTNVTEGEATWVTYPLTVTETVAGDPATLPQREGRPVLYVLSGLEDVPELRAGQEAFLLLYSRWMDNPIVGFAQGVYPIVNGRVTRSGEAEGTGTGASTASSTTPSGSATTTSGAGTTPSTVGGTPTSSTGTATSPTAPGSVTSTTGGTPTTASSTTPAASGTATTAPGTSTSGTATATTPGTTSSTTTPGAASPTAGGATTSSTATGTTPSATVSAPGATTPNSTAGSTPTTTTPASGATSPAATTPPVNDPNAIPSDPARFRDALRAAREGR
nr:hypothetical protein [Deinococcus aestuarii]